MTMRRATWLASLLLSVAAASAAPADTTDPFKHPVKDCRPCRFSPGRGQPAFDLTFVFDGSGDDKTLAALEIVPVDGGTAQRLDTGGIAVADFPDGFSLEIGDLRRDGSGDLGIVNLVAPDNSTEEYWLYEPKRHEFVALRRDPDHGDTCPLELVPDTHELHCHIRDGYVGYADIWYRIEGNRTVALREIEQSTESPLAVLVTTDLSVTPNRVAKTVVGFVGDSPARDAFRQQLDAASKQAAARFQKADKAGAVAALEPLLKDKDLWTLTNSVPVTDDNDPADLRLVAELNDYGFYLEEAGRPADAIDVLAAVIDLNPTRIVAYLNLADARFAAGDPDGAKTNYAEYRKRMIADGKATRIPPRVAERLR